jgi:hypothetical protein
VTRKATIIDRLRPNLSEITAANGAPAKQASNRDATIHDSFLAQSALDNPVLPTVSKKAGYIRGVRVKVNVKLGLG